jgi:hypothetical protein
MPYHGEPTKLLGMNGRITRASFSPYSSIAMSGVCQAMDYMLKRWAAFTRSLADGRICLTNNVAERQLRGIALGRKSWLFAGSDRGGERTYTRWR